MVRSVLLHQQQKTTPKTFYWNYQWLLWIDVKLHYYCITVIFACIICSAAVFLPIVSHYVMTILQNNERGMNQTCSLPSQSRAQRKSLKATKHLGGDFCALNGQILLLTVLCTFISSDGQDKIPQLKNRARNGSAWLCGCSSAVLRGIDVIYITLYIWNKKHHELLAPVTKCTNIYAEKSCFVSRNLCTQFFIKNCAGIEQLAQTFNQKFFVFFFRLIKYNPGVTGLNFLREEFGFIKCLCNSKPSLFYSLS